MRRVMKCAVQSSRRFRSSSKALDFQALFESIDDECSETTMSSRHIPLLPARLALCHFLTKHVAASWWAELCARVPAPLALSRETNFLSGGFDSAMLVNDLANTCCSVIVAAAFANGLHIHRPAGKTPGDDSTGLFHVWD